MVYHNVKKINHTFNYSLIYYMGNYTQFLMQRLNSEYRISLSYTIITNLRRPGLEINGV